MNKEEHVNHPGHYNQGGIECIDAMAAATAGLKGIEAVDTAQVIKYIWRWKYKNGVEDLCKCVWYLGDLAKRINGFEQFYKSVNKWIEDNPYQIKNDDFLTKLDKKV